MGKAANILEAWKNFIIKDESIEQEAKQRAKTCSICPSAKHGKFLRYIKDELKEVEGMYCNDCGCPLTAKIRSKEVCKKWKQGTKP